LIKAVNCPEIKYLSSEGKDVLAFITTRFLNVSATTLSRATHTLYFERKKQGERLKPLSFLSNFKKTQTDDIE